MASRTIDSCGSCGYPLTLDYIGQVSECPNCHTVNEAIAQGVSRSAVVLAGLIGLLIGIMAGPSILVASEEGRKQMEELTRRGVSKL